MGEWISPKLTALHRLSDFATKKKLTSNFLLRANLTAANGYGCFFSQKFNNRISEIHISRLYDGIENLPLDEFVIKKYLMTLQLMLGISVLI